MFQGLHHFKVADSYIAESNILKYPDFNDLLGKKIPQYNYNQHALNSYTTHSDQITILTIFQLFNITHFIGKIK